MMVDGAEKTTSQSNTKVPDEKQMVKRFRRSAAGYDEQLPSDIRPPRVLQRTLNYLFDEVIGGAPLATVHKFVWDRTRSIRNDFSIQRVTKLDDLKIAIDCFERIARFHILSLHQLSRQDEDNGEFDHHQEREQLNNTLLSLMYYYDDSRSILTSANEAEFRAYCIIFEIQDQRPDLEDRVQLWPRSLIYDKRVQIALKIYAAAGNSSDEQGPLRPRTSFSIAQANSARFWALVQSQAVPYILACVAEIYFNFIRSTALETIWKAYKVKRPGPQPHDWVLSDLTPALGFDHEDQTRDFCEDHGFSILEKESGEAYVELGSVTGKYLTDSKSRRKQIFSQTIVEAKRLGRTLPAVINGLSVSEAQAQGLVQDPAETFSSSASNNESLFITGDSDEETKKEVRETDTSKPKDKSTKKTAVIGPSTQPLVPTPTIFGKPSSKPNPFATVGTFGVPTPLTSVSQPSNSSATSKPSTPTLSGSNPFDKPPKFNFWPNKTATNDSSISLPTTTPPAALPVQETKSPEDPPSSIFKVPAPFQTDSKSTKPLFGAQDEKSPNNPISTPPSPKTSDSTTQVGLIPSASATKPSATISNPFQWPKPPITTESAPVSKPFFDWQKPSAATQASQSDPKLTSLSEVPEPPTAREPSSTFSFFNEPPKTKESSSLFSFLNEPPKTEESSSPFSFLNEPPKTEESSSPFPTLNEPPKSKVSNPPFVFPNEPTIPPKRSTTDDSGMPSPFSAPNDTSSAADPSKLSGQFSPSQITPTLPNQDPIQPATESSKNIRELKLAPANILPSLRKPNLSPFMPATSPAEQAKVKPPEPDPRPAVLEQLSASLMTDEGGLFAQFMEYTLSSVVKNAFYQVKDEQSWERAGEVRAILLSKKYFKRWKRIAWARGLRRGKDERRKLAQSMREKPGNPPQQQEDLGRSLLVNESGRGRQETISMAPPSRNKRKSLPDDLDLHSQRNAETPASKKQKLVNDSGGGRQETNLMAPPSRNKRKSLPDDLDLHAQQTAETPVSKKQRREERIQKAQLLASRRIENHHRRSKTLGSPLSLPRVREHSNSLRSFRPDFSHLGDGSILSHKVLQKARHLVPSVKLDTTRTDYFLLKSRGIDSNTTLIPRASRKRPRDEPHPDGIKIRKPSQPDPYSPAAGRFSVNSVKVSTSARAGTSSANNVKPSISARAGTNSAKNFRPPTAATTISSSTNDVQLSRSAPAASANEEYDSDEALLAQVRAVRHAMEQDIAWFRAEREKSRFSATTSSSSRKSKKQHISPRNETEKERRLREFKSTPSRTEQRLKATKANGLLPTDWNGFGEMRAAKANTKAARSPERDSSRPVTVKDETVDITDWEGEEETSEEYEDDAGFEQDWEYSNVAKGKEAKGSSFEDAIEL